MIKIKIKILKFVLNRKHFYAAALLNAVIFPENSSSQIPTQWSISLLSINKWKLDQRSRRINFLKVWSMRGNVFCGLFREWKLSIRMRFKPRNNHINNCSKKNECTAFELWIKCMIDLWRQFFFYLFYLTASWRNDRCFIRFLYTAFLDSLKIHSFLPSSAQNSEA